MTRSYQSAAQRSFAGLLMNKTSNFFKPIKLRAIDDRDLLIFSQCLYESIVLPSEIVFNKDEKCFAIAIERFTWEIAEGKDHKLMQVLSILIINGVLKIEGLNNDILNSICTISSISNLDNNILMLLNNKHTLNLKVKNWSCTLEDIGEPKWPATTPVHFQNN